MTRAKAIFIALLLLQPLGCYAGRMRGLLSLGADFGGDELLKLTYKDGSEASVLAGQGLLVSGGIVWQAWSREKAALDLQATAGWMYSSIPEASNQDVSWTRWPIEALAFFEYLPAHIRLGGGLSYQVAPTLSASGSLLNGDFKFQNALGELVQLDVTFARHFLIAARYTWLDYHPETDPKVSFNGNSVGFSVAYLF